MKKRLNDILENCSCRGIYHKLVKKHRDIFYEKIKRKTYWKYTKFDITNLIKNEYIKMTLGL